jgi:CRISPR-associated endonuclease/helicase Cas3
MEMVSFPSEQPLVPTAASLWAKLCRDGARRITGWHSLVDHSADVAAVVAALLEQPTINQRLARAAGRDALDTITCARLAALAFLHDIGKANRGFRRRVDPAAQPVGHIDQLGWLLFPGSFAEKYFSRLIAVLGLERTASWFVRDDDVSEFWCTLLAHHGRPWRKRGDVDAYWKPDATGSDPIADLAVMRTALDKWFTAAFADGPQLPSAPAFHHAFAGLLMLADWLGSDTQFFPYANGAADNRMAYAGPQARRALQAVGLAVEDRRRAVRTGAPQFADLFGVSPPRAVQRDATRPTARCVVLEAETGSGKTEAALWRFRHLFAEGAVDGLYFALPTRVAATQMFGRIKRFRDALFPAEDRPAVVLAVPGQVGADDAAGHALPDFGFDWTDDPDAATRQARWAAEHPKRFLAAQIAVGTVDQVLLAAIATRHAHLRGTALLRHLLVVDEVHASDRYMETLLGNLLSAHVAAGGHALLLSATLGAGMRARLLGTACPPLAEAVALPYPALSWAEGGRASRHAIESFGPVKSVRIDAAPLIDDAAAIAAAALRAAEAGAKVLVIRNTVGAAIATAMALEVAAGPSHPALFRVEGIPTLHHGRFAPADRHLLDAAIEAALGRQSAAESRVVIGTQTLEQSLDLDADLLLTDLCPVDVLLQRIGRLHRHLDRRRPPGFAEPRAVVLTPPVRDLLKLLRAAQGRHGLGWVYDDPRIIEATWRLIETVPVWHIPAMNRELVEHATHPERLATIEDALRARDPAWARPLDQAYGKTTSRVVNARLAVLDRNAPFSRFQIDADEYLSTRLGAKDLLVALPAAPPGPFGRPIETIRVPHFLAVGVSEADAPELLGADADGLRIRLGPVELRYDRLGLRRES